MWSQIQPVMSWKARLQARWMGEGGEEGKGRKGGVKGQKLERK